MSDHQEMISTLDVSNTSEQNAEEALLARDLRLINQLSTRNGSSPIKERQHKGIPFIVCYVDSIL